MRALLSTRCARNSAGMASSSNLKSRGTILQGHHDDLGGATRLHIPDRRELQAVSVYPATPMGCMEVSDGAEEVNY